MPNISQPNQGPRGDGSPCTIVDRKQKWTAIFKKFGSSYRDEDPAAYPAAAAAALPGEDCWATEVDALPLPEAPCGE